MNAPLWFFWGGRSMTYLRYLTLRSAVEIHPDVRLIVRDPVTRHAKWVERQDDEFHVLRDWRDRIAELPVVVHCLEELAPQIAALQLPDPHTKDLLGFWLLANHGGTVADMDILFIGPLPEITRAQQVVRFSGDPKPDYVPVTFLQGVPCESWHASYDFALAAADPGIYESCGTDCVVLGGDVTLLPECVVFPWAGKPWLAPGSYDVCQWQRWNLVEATWPEIPEECVGIHWYAGQSQVENQMCDGPESLPAGAVGYYARRFS